MNANEQLAYDWLVERGPDDLIVLRNGWPDFLLVHPMEDYAIGVEVKSASDRLRPEQRRMHYHLAEVGVMTHLMVADVRYGHVEFDPVPTYYRALGFEGGPT